MGDLGVAVKQLMDDYQKQSKMNEKLSSIEDMQSFMERYPAFRSQSINCSKHVALMGELMRLTDKGSLLDVSGLEQDVASSTTEHSLHKKQLLEKIQHPKILPADRLRLALLYIIKYESYNETNIIKRALSESGLGAKETRLLDALIDYAGESRRAPGLFSQGSLVSQIGKVFSDITVGGMENHYTQHQPLLSTLLESIVKGKLKDSAYPLASDTQSSTKPTEIIVFIVGGATFEEATKVNAFNQANPSLKVILGGSCVHNSRSFLKEIGEFF